MDTTKEILFEEEVRQKLASGVHALAQAIGKTHGPSKTASKEASSGYAISQEIELEDRSENLGASLAKETLAKVHTSCKDGTTRTALLLDALVSEGMNSIASGVNPIDLKRGMDNATDQICEQLEKTAFPIPKDHLKSLALLAADGDPEIGTTVVSALEKAGKTGALMVDANHASHTTLETVDGMQLESGYVSPYFCTDPATMTTTFENASILLVANTITSPGDLLPVLKSASNSSFPLLIVTTDIQGDALSTLIANKLCEMLHMAVVKTSKNDLEDLAALVEGNIIDKNLSQASPKDFGYASRVFITKDTTTLLATGNTSARIEEIDHAIEQSPQDISSLKERRAKLCQGVVLIKVGGTTEDEIQHKKQRYIESLRCAKEALQAGSVVGGGIALLRASQAVNLEGNADEQTGAQIVLKACQSPIQQLAANAGFEGSNVLEQVLQSTGNTGFNVKMGRLEDLKEEVCDPKPVVIESLRQAASAAGKLLLTDVAMVRTTPETE